jgi:hypothetical protein
VVPSVSKRPTGPRPIAALLGSSALGDVVGEARAGDRVLAALRRALPADLAVHLSAAHLRDATLIVVADGPAWATRLRFLEPELKAALDARTRRVVRRVAVRVGPPVPAPRAPAPAASRPLSAAARAALESGAAGVTDPKLAAALRRLARRR